jgi:hypothetical protein
MYLGLFSKVVVNIAVSIGNSNLIAGLEISLHSIFLKF